MVKRIDVQSSPRNTVFPPLLLQSVFRLLLAVAVACLAFPCLYFAFTFYLFFMSFFSSLPSVSSRHGGRFFVYMI